MDPVTATESTYHYYMSNCPIRPGSSLVNSASNFVTQRDHPLHFPDMDNWEVGLCEVFIPSLHYNIYPPFNKDVLEIRKISNMGKWRGSFASFTSEDFLKSEPVASVSLHPGFYTPKSFCATVNDLVMREIFTAGSEDVRKAFERLTREGKPIPPPPPRPAPKRKKRSSSNPAVKRVRESQQGGNVEHPTTTADKGPDPSFINEDPKNSEFCPKEYKPGYLWDTTDCGPLPQWWKDQKKIYQMQMQEIGDPESEDEREEIIADPEQLNRLMDTSRRVLIKVKDPTDKLRLTLPPGYFVLCQNPRIQKLLGWSDFQEEMVSSGQKFMHAERKAGQKSIIYGNASQLHYRAILLPQPCDFGRNNRIVYLYSNLVKSSVVGKDNLPLFKILTLSDVSFRTPLFHQKFELPQFLPIRQSNFSNIEFFLANDLGEEFPFQRGENTILVVRFRYTKSR